MEDLELVQAWLENEKELRPLLEKMAPLLKRRAELEEKLPRLVHLRSPSEILPSEASSYSAPAASPPASSASILVDTGKPMIGLPPRPVPEFEKFQKMVEKKKLQNRKKHEKDKKRREAGKKALEGMNLEISD